MSFFVYFTPLSYWLLVILWSCIFYFYLHRIVNRKLQSKLFVTLLTILAIDAFRTLFESVYFGAWYTSLVGFIPKHIHDFLILPQSVIIPKSINVIAAALVLFIVVRKWVPEEEKEREDEVNHLHQLELEISRRKEAEKENEKIIDELKDALNEIKTLRGILPICMFCKKIRDNKGYWNQIESYIHEHSNATFSHGLCLDCAKKNYPEIYEGN
jgi:hypothetical protein